MRRSENSSGDATSKVSARVRLAMIPALGAWPIKHVATVGQSTTPDATPAGTPEATPMGEGRVLPVEQIAQLTGPAETSLNSTWEEFEVYGTDLGHTFIHGESMYMVFGDTFAISNTDWRCNTAAKLSADQDPADGLIIVDMITDREGHAQELLPAKKIDFDEITVIPTYGVAVGDRLFLHYMSVHNWGTPGVWTLNESGLAYWDDDGQSWTKDEAVRWSGESNFGQVSIVEHDAHLYIHGIPGGRFGGVQLARVAPENLLDLTMYEYWDGTDWTGDIAAAESIVPAPVGELSVRWNAYYNTWVMMYLNEDRTR